MVLRGGDRSRTSCYAMVSHATCQRGAHTFALLFFDVVYLVLGNSVSVDKAGVGDTVIGLLALRAGCIVMQIRECLVDALQITIEKLEYLCTSQPRGTHRCCSL